MTRANFPLMLIVFLTAFLGSSAVNVLQADTTYYVDAIAGDDSSQGTAEQPFKTYLPFVWTYGERDPDIGKITLQPGDQVVFRKGVYSATYQTPTDVSINNYRGLYIRGIAGSVTAPVIIRGEPGAIIDATPPQQPGISAESTSMEFESCSNLVVSGLEFTGLGRALRVTGSSNISINNNWMHDIDGTDNNNMEPLQLVGNIGKIDIFNNLFQDNFDRTNADTNGQKTENSRHIGSYSNQGIVRIHHNYVFNTLPITTQFSGSGIVNKHGGDSFLEVDRNVIARVWGSSVGTNNPNSDIHRNLIIESDEIVVKDFGGPSYFNNIVVSLNTFADCDGGFLYRPNDVWYPFNGFNDIGSVSFIDNLVTDVSTHNGENGSISIGSYVEPGVAEKLMAPGILNSEGNRFSHPEEFRAIWFFGLPFYETLDFQQWQAFSFDLQGNEGLQLDDCFFPTNGSDLGWYQEDGIRLSLFAIEDNQMATAPRFRRGQEVAFKLVRSGDGVDLGSAFTASFEPSVANQILLPQQVTFLPGQRSVDVTATILSDVDLDSEIALLVSPTANGTENNVGAWVRIAADSLLGDANQNGSVDFLDISPFIGLLASNTYLAQADCNQDGVLNFLDIAPFITILAAQ